MLGVLKSGTNDFRSELRTDAELKVQNRYDSGLGGTVGSPDTSNAVQIWLQSIKWKESYDVFLV